MSMINDKNKKVKNFSWQNQEGLTLLELLTTIAILVATVTTVLVLGNKAISQSELFSLHAEATFLAEEGIELLTDNDLRSQMRGEMGEVGEYYWEVDYSGQMKEETSKDNCGKMWINTVNGKRFYDHNNEGEETPFSRCLTAQKTEGNKLEVKSESFFNYRGEDYAITLYRIFYN